MNKILHIVIGLIFIENIVTAEVIKSVQCTSSREQTNGVLEVTQLRVNPCPEPGDGQTVPCFMPRGTVGNISVDFIPKEDVSRLDVGLAYVSIIGDLPFTGVDSNSCNNIDSGNDCPLRANKTYTWTTAVTLLRAYPSGKYPLKLKFTDGQRRPKVFLCQIFSIQLT